MNSDHLSDWLKFINSNRPNEGDFGLENNLINKDHKNYIFTGCQILNKSVFKNIIGGFSFFIASCNSFFVQLSFS